MTGVNSATWKDKEKLKKPNLELLEYLFSKMNNL